MRVGDTVLRQPSFYTSYGGACGNPQNGTVVYIHPERRFYTVEFLIERTGERFRESYYPPKRQGCLYDADMTEMTRPRLPGEPGTAAAHRTVRRDALYGSFGGGAGK